MSYEYKEILKAAVRDFLTGTLQQDSKTGEYLNLGEVEENYSDISIELDQVYAQATKADEYEAKAKAFDEVIYAINSSSNPGLNGSSYIDAADFTSKVEYILRKYESGEYDA